METKNSHAVGLRYLSSLEALEALEVTEGTGEAFAELLENCEARERAAVIEELDALTGGTLDRVRVELLASATDDDEAHDALAELLDDVARNLADDGGAAAVYFRDDVLEIYQDGRRSLGREGWQASRTVALLAFGGPDVRFDSDGLLRVAWWGDDWSAGSVAPAMAAYLDGLGDLFG
jgi:hypothetical protein